MNCRLTQKVTALVCAAAMLWAPGSAGACSLFGPRPAYSVGYAPAAQTCNYMPQTCYRTVYVNTPVTSYRPIAACDPCTGCPTTVMRPVTTYMPQARMIPYTTYQPVFSSPCGASPCGVASPCSTCGAAPVATTFTSAPAAPPACCGGSTLPAMSAPSLPPTMSVPLGTPGAMVPSLSPTPGPVTTQYAPPITTQPLTVAPPTGSNIVPGATYAPPTGAPAYSPSAPATTYAPPTSPGYAPPTPGPTLAPPTTGPANNTTQQPNPTFRDTPGADAPANESRLKPVPDPLSTNKSTGGVLPRRDVDRPDRTTSLPVRGAWAYQNAALSGEIQPVTHVAPLTADANDGWRAAR